MLALLFALLRFHQLPALLAGIMLFNGTVALVPCCKYTGFALSLHATALTASSFLRTALAPLIALHSRGANSLCLCLTLLHRAHSARALRFTNFAARLDRTFYCTAHSSPAPRTCTYSEPATCLQPGMQHSHPTPAPLACALSMHTALFAHPLPAAAFASQSLRLASRHRTALAALAL